MTEMADSELASEIKFHAKKYMVSSYVFGANVWLFSYNLLKLRLIWYVAMPISFSLGFVVRNYIMKNCIDRIYYPGHQVYNRFREEEKNQE
jgi:hypothetical protein